MQTLVRDMVHVTPEERPDSEKSYEDFGMLKNAHSLTVKKGLEKTRKELEKSE